MSDDLAYLSATDALSLFKQKALSPVELTKAVIARADATEPEINAFSYRYFEEAIQQAQQAETRYMGKGDPPAPLDGLCVAVKDSGHIAGQPTSYGSQLESDAPQEATSPINQRIAQAGAIVHARTTTPEYSCAAYTHSRRWGVTRNPWNLAMTPGGSSGGAAASLAAGTATLASGSDIAGSIRIPASCCGVVGYKPPRGRNPVDAPFNLDAFCHTGPLARTVADTMLFQNILCGPHPDDPFTLPKHHISASAGSLKGLRIGVSFDLGFFEIDPDVRAATSAAIDQLAQLGADVREVALPWDWAVIDAALTHLRANFGTSIAPDNAQDWELMSDYARAFARAGQDIDTASQYAALTLVGQMGKDFGALMQAFDLLICPTTAIPAVPAEFNQATDDLIINGRSVDPMLGWVMTAPFNMIGSAPVLSVPSARASNGVPIGLQFVGRPYDDDTVFKAALSYEAARGAWFTSKTNTP